MEVYFTINEGSALYVEYFEWLKDKEKMQDAFDKITEKYGIEANAFAPSTTELHISPKGEDLKRFAEFLKKTNFGQFKKNSPMAKDWCELVKDVQNPRKPSFFKYFRLLGHRWRERLFHVGATLYGSVESDGTVSVPEFVTEMKASDFFKVIEEEMEKQN